MFLRDIIIDTIKASGPVSFRDYMDMCLYYPDLGYYNSTEQKIGKGGDFYTSSSLTSSFGATIARQMVEMSHVLKKDEFTIVEYGAGLGSFCKDILDALSCNAALYSVTRYCIIEKSIFMRKCEQENLKDYHNVFWYNRIDEIPGSVDCVFSNELLDNFPVHQVVMKDQLMEIFVDYKGDFFEILRPASQELKDYFLDLGVCLPYGYRTEVCLDTFTWIQNIAVILEKGFIITIDYGDESEKLYKERRKNGTVVCYHEHNISQNPFCAIGKQDITAHINFSALEYWGERQGLMTCGITPQAYFLTSLGFRECLTEAGKKQGKANVQLAKEMSCISYTLLFDMGNKYKVLIQSKGLPEMRLTGLPFA